MKLLYYLDFRHYRETGHSVTGQTYAAWRKGPVPVDVWAEIRKGEDRNCGLHTIVKILPTAGNVDAFGFDLKLLAGRRFDDYFFSPCEKRILEDVSFIFKGVPASEIIDATHMPGTPWETVVRTQGEGRPIPYELALASRPKEYIDAVHEEQRDREALSAFFGTPL
ncbi:MAG: SocA family protein [Deltaproteobacteria bacterium]|nr:SocA family protein [Deltaproteobacteria bacterium]